MQNLAIKPGSKPKIKKALKNFNTYVDLATEDNVEDKALVLKDLYTMVQVLHDNVPMPCQEMDNVIETLKRIYDLSGNRFEIPQVWTCQK